MRHLLKVKMLMRMVMTPSKGVRSVFSMAPKLDPILDLLTTPMGSLLKGDSKLSGREEHSTLRRRRIQLH